MCGIVGVAGDLDSPARSIFDRMLFIDTIRGSHATGIVTVQKEGEYTWMKDSVAAPTFLKTPDYEKTRKVSDMAWIGHNRYATVGALTTANAHPFEHDPIIGVHNGSLSYGWQEYLSSNLEAPSFGTDSETLMWCIAEHGIEKVIPHISGAYALVIFDSAANELIFLRNKDRPLYLGVTKDRRQLYWASQDSIFFAARDCSSLTKGVTLSEQGMVLLEPNLLVRVKLPKTWSDKFDPKEFIVKPLHGRTTPYPFRSTGYNYGGYNDGWENEWERDIEVYRKQREKREKETEARKVISFKKATPAENIVSGFLDWKGKRLQKTGYIKKILRDSPGNPSEAEHAREKLKGLKESVKVLFPPDLPYSNLTRKSAVKFVNMKRRIVHLEDQLSLYDGTFDYTQTPDEIWEVKSDDLMQASDKEFQEHVTHNGCYSCGEKSTESDPWDKADCLVFNKHEYTCPHCSKQAWVKDLYSDMNKGEQSA